MFQGLSKRERQIMDVIYMLREATAAQVLSRMPEGSTDASVRKLVRILEEKGHLTHRREGREHVYSPTIPEKEARRHAAQHLLATLFRGSLPEALSALLDASYGDLSEEEARKIRRLIDQAEAEGR